jgi:hypothetical protein
LEGKSQALNHRLVEFLIGLCQVANSSCVLLQGLSAVDVDAQVHVALLKAAGDISRTPSVQLHSTSPVGEGSGFLTSGSSKPAGFFPDMSFNQQDNQDVSSIR